MCVCRGQRHPWVLQPALSPLGDQTRAVRKGAQLRAAPLCSRGHSQQCVCLRVYVSMCLCVCVCAPLLGVLEHMLCRTTGGTGRDSPAAALDPRWKKPCPCAGTRSRKSASLTRQCPTQGWGHPVLFPGPAWGQFVPGLASPQPVAKAVLVVFLVGEELGGVRQDQKPQGAALPGCSASGGSNGTVPEHPVGDTYSFLSALITSFSLQ